MQLEFLDDRRLPTVSWLLRRELLLTRILQRLIDEETLSFGLSIISYF